MSPSRPGEGMRRVCATVLVALLAIGAPRQAFSQLAEAVGIIDCIVTLLSISQEIMQLDADAAGDLPLNQPAILLQSFSVKTPSREFNVGDRASLNLRFTVSYGPVGDVLSLFHQGKGSVRVYVDRKLYQEFSFQGAPGAKLETRQFKADIIARHVGSADVHCVVTVQGEEKKPLWPRHVIRAAESEETENEILEIEPPYRVWIEGPSPERVHHGDVVKASLMVEIHTQAPGEIGSRTHLEGRRPSPTRLPGADNPGAVKTLKLVTVTKRWNGCRYGQDGRNIENLDFSSADYEIIVRFGDGKRFVQSHQDRPLVPISPAISEALVCSGGEVRMGKGGCECGKESEIAKAGPPTPEPPPSPAPAVPEPELVLPPQSPDASTPEPEPIEEEPVPEDSAVAPTPLPEPSAPPELPTDRVIVPAPKTALSIEVEEVSVHPGTDARVYRVTLKGTERPLGLVVEAPTESPCRALGEAPLRLRTCGGEANTAWFWCNGRGAVPRHFEIEVLSEERK